MGEDQYKFFLYEDVRSVQNSAYWAGVLAASVGWVGFVLASILILAYL